MAWNSAATAQVIAEAAQSARKSRAPLHPHLIEHRPWQIQPFMIAPVLPGETLKNLNLQSRVISDPLAAGAGNLLPWWADHYFYYVKARQLGDTVRTAFEAMMIDGTPLGIVDPPDAATYHPGKSINWTKRCLEFIVQRGGFRDDGEPVDPRVDGLPVAAAHRHGQSWLDSLQPDVPLPADQEPLQNPHDPDVLAEYQAQYDRMRQMRFIDMTFEDYLEQQGVSLPQQGLLDRPELLRLSSEWGYPANTVEPTTGLPSGAFATSVNLSSDKSRFFTEPGFIVGVTVVRPKIFLGNQAGSAIQLLDQPFAFLPRIMEDQPHISIKKFEGGADAVATGPLRNQTIGYWIDIGDLYRYGDQFVRFADAKGFRPALPDAAGNYRFATSAMMDAVFSAPAANKIRQDGVTRLAILGHQQTVVDNT